MIRGLLIKTIADNISDVSAFLTLPIPHACASAPPRESSPSGPGKPPAEDAVAFSTWFGGG
jgi:hypothetical protein